MVGVLDPMVKRTACVREPRRTESLPGLPSPHLRSSLRILVNRRFHDDLKISAGPIRAFSGELVKEILSGQKLHSRLRVMGVQAGGHQHSISGLWIQQPADQRESGACSGIGVDTGLPGCLLVG